MPAVLTTSHHPKAEKEEVPSELFFTERCKELAEKSKEPGNHIQHSSEEDRALDKIVKEVIDTKATPALISLADKSISDPSLEKEQIYKEISQEVKERFGLSSCHQEVVAKIKAWNQENLNTEIKKEKNREEAGPRSDENKQEKPKILIFIILDKLWQLVMKLIGLKSIYQPKQKRQSSAIKQKKRDRKNRSKRSRKKNLDLYK